MASRHPANSVHLPQFTCISSKGQVVIPKPMRSALGLKEGDILAASTVNDDMIVLKKVTVSFTKDDEQTLKKIAASWQEIDSGKYKRMSKEEFLKQLHKW